MFDLRGDAENPAELPLRHDTVLLDGLPNDRLERPRPQEGVQKNPGRARGGAAAG
tara:strand:+ start:204 stop:368 length:165 start_codon:yes stop_codon:yes gene_type:complete